MNLQISAVSLEEIEPTLQHHVRNLPSPIDSFLEDHILHSAHYQLLIDGMVAGWTSVHQQTLLTQFHLLPAHRRHGQQLFQRVRKLESMQAAFVPTCDEFFLSHALDDYRQVEKQAYFFQHDPAAERSPSPQPLTFRQADHHDIPTIQSLSGTFFGDIERRVQAGELYLTQREEACVGFGLMERSRLLDSAASIGMYTVEGSRRSGYGAATIAAPVDRCAQLGLRPVAGCWYYNHGSKKTLEKARMYSQTRLLKISY